jgi:UDP-N-acetylmuramoyl-tripeptide--D-alanyl-D-alanine ligase
MALWHHFSTAFNWFFPFGDFLFILQHEEYDSGRYWHWLKRFFFRRGFQVREKLVKTARVKITIWLAWILWLNGAVAGLWILNTWWQIALFVVIWLLTIPIITWAANDFLNPLFEIAKARRRRQAAAKINARGKELTIVAVAGSYGKTTVKHFIQQLVKFTSKTQLIPGTINTPAGIADWVIAHLRPDTQVLIVEMDTYGIGEITRSCSITPPDIAVLTNIGDQHLERHGTRERLTHALGELFKHAKPTATLITSPLAFELLKKADVHPGPDQKVKLVKLEEKNTTYQGRRFVLSKFSGSTRENIHLTLAVADALKVPARYVLDSLSHLELPDRRQRQTELFGYDALDDSFNISYTTGVAGIEAARALATQKKKKLLIITAGIPELAPDERGKNRELGQKLSEHSDHVVILQSIFAPELVVGMGEGGYTLVKSLQKFLKTAHQQFSPKEWFLLLQPELHDLYY